MNEHRSDLKDMPHRRGFATLGSKSQAAIASSLLRGLGFDTKVGEPVAGLSGLIHSVPVIGVNAEHKKVIVIQTGAEQLARFFPSYTYKPLHAIATDPPKKSPEELRLEWLQRSLFTSFDLRAAFEAVGWSCNGLIFFNSFEVPVADMAEEERQAWWSENGMPAETTMTMIGAHDPIGELDVTALREHVVATGSSFVDANQLSVQELVALSRSGEDCDLEQVKTILSRIRLANFFRPPLDELLLGTLKKAGHIEVTKLEEAASIANNRGHEIVANTVVPAARHSDPEETIRHLKDLGMVTFKRQEIFIEESGKIVAQQWEKTPEEPLFVKVLRELRLPELVSALVRAFGGGA
jgi:hypothetical protein